MKKAAICMLIVFFSGIAYAGILQKDSCTPGSTQRCVCPDGTKKEQTCSADGISWEACDCTYYTAWCDEATDLCWQDPQKDYYKEGDDGVEPADAVRYCRNLSFGGYSDWRLPTIAELRTLVRGNPLTVTGGACPMGNESTSADMNDENCGPVDLYEGPGIGGCYWPEELTGSCSRPDVASEGHPLEFASSTRCPDDPTKDWYGVVMFENSAVCWNHVNTLTDVRCVRGVPTSSQICARKGNCLPGETRRCLANNLKIGAQVCADEGDCWGACEGTSFMEKPAKKDVCPSCDQINLTINLPEELTMEPAQIMAFLYERDTWTFPPNRPPDGGNSECQILEPDIKYGTPYTMTVPACTYYRKKCLKGEYMLYVALMQTEINPPIMLEGDSWWGMDQEPLVLGGTTGQQIDLEINLVKYVAE